MQKEIIDFRIYLNYEIAKASESRGKSDNGELEAESYGAECALRNAKRKYEEIFNINR